jgi:hypothetical protein
VTDDIFTPQVATHLEVTEERWWYQGGTACHTTLIWGWNGLPHHTDIRVATPHWYQGGTACYTTLISGWKNLPHHTDRVEQLATPHWYQGGTTCYTTLISMNTAICLVLHCVIHRNEDIP